MVERYEPASEQEAADLERMRELVATAADPYDRRSPLHLTGSAVVVHLPTARVLLRWHARQQSWLHVGGHGDVGERHLFDVALREATEETGLADLTPFPPVATSGSRTTSGVAQPLHVAIVPVAPRGDEPAHEHVDVRFVLSTAEPESARAETPDAPVRWVGVEEARAEATDTLAETFARLDLLVRGNEWRP